MAVRSIGAVIRAHADRKPADAIAIVFGEDRLTWRELEARSNQRTRQLQSNGVAQDDLVAIMLPNGVAFHEAALAAWKAGATPCVVSSRLPDREMTDILAVAAPKAVIGDVPGLG